MKQYPRKLVLGSRGSELALWQAGFVRDKLLTLGSVDVEIKVIKTQGDRETSLTFTQMTGQGFFTREIEHALLDGEIDLAVHSFKDLETTLPEGLCVAAVPQRADRRDMILLERGGVDESRLWGLRQQAVVGSSSARRAAQILHSRPDLKIKPLRGNIPSRVEKLRRSEYDAIILAVAAVQRLGLRLDGLRRVDLDENVFVPAPAQGALAVETRADDPDVNTLVSRIDDPDLREIVEAERTVMRRIGGGCQLPLGVCGTRRENCCSMRAFLGSGDAHARSSPCRVSVTAKNPVEATNIVVETLARSSNYSSSAGFNGRKFVITRTGAQTADLRRAIEAAGGELVSYPTLQVIEAGDPVTQRKTLARLDDFEWILFSSSNGVEMFYQLLTKFGAGRDLKNRIAVMGPGTAAVFERLSGRSVDFIPAISTGEGFAGEFIRQHGRTNARLLFPTTAERRGALERRLHEAGIGIEPLVIYNTVQPEGMPEWDGRADAVVFTSPKAARHFLAMAELPPGAKIVSIGPATTDYLVERRLLPVYEAFTHDSDGILEALDVHFG